MYKKTIVHFKQVNFMACELYFNKDVKNLMRNSSFLSLYSYQMLCLVSYAQYQEGFWSMTTLIYDNSETESSSGNIKLHRIILMDYCSFHGSSQSKTTFFFRSNSCSLHVFFSRNTNLYIYLSTDAISPKRIWNHKWPLWGSFW